MGDGACVKEIMDIILAVSTLVLALSTVVLAFATVKMARESRDGSYRQIGVQTWIEFARRFDSFEMMKAREELAKKMKNYSPTERKHKGISENVLNFFEDLGALYENGYIDKVMAVDTFSYHASRWWEVSKSYIDHERKSHGEDPSLFSNFGKFATVCRVAFPDDVIDADEIQNFLLGESNLAPTTLSP